MLIKTKTRERKPIPFTPQELMSLHGLTIEKALGAGYPVVGYSQNKKSHRGAATPSAAKKNNTVK